MSFSGAGAACFVEWESRDSASPAIGRAVAAAHRGLPFQALAFPRWMRLAMAAVNEFPLRARIAAVRLESWRAALPLGSAGEVTSEGLVAVRLADYRRAPAKVEVIVLGAALGGVAAHLSVALGGFFLPQPFVLTFRGGSRDDSLAGHLACVSRLAPLILKRNPDLLLLSHFDPVHDAWLTREVTHIRLKLLRLPAGYRQFIRERLRPGGALVVLDCAATWPQGVLGNRQRVQVGGWGGIAPREFLHGSERLDQWLVQQGSLHRGGWASSDLAFQAFPESEWGLEPSFAEDTAEFAARYGYRFLHLRLEHPHAFSLLALEAQRLRCQKEAIEPQGLLVETFGHYDPLASDRAALLPLWLIFNTWDSHAFLERVLAELPGGLAVLFCHLVTFALPPDRVPWDAWHNALRGRRAIHLGPKPEKYPADLPALWRWHEDLWRWVKEHPRPLRLCLRLEDLAELASQVAHDVRWLDSPLG
jgi:hypothetical protein